MNNYEYITAIIPDFDAGTRTGLDTGAVLEEMRELLSEKDRNVLDLLLEGCRTDSLDRGFYLKAAESGSRFIRDYFAFDRMLRNAKVRYLNTALGRPEGQDTVTLDDGTDAAEEEFEAREEAAGILSGSDILARERALDDLVWNHIDEITSLEVFSLDLILGIAVKLMIVGRWLSLDETSGRERFRRLADEIRNTKTNIQI